MKTRRIRTKPCHACKRAHDALFRARPDCGDPWQFYCRACLLKLKASSRSYTYGGTWKSKKRT